MEPSTPQSFIAQICTECGCPGIASPLTEGYNAILESASSVLYHFVTAGNLCQMIRNNRFTPSDHESSLHGGKKFMSFSRTGNFEEGWPALFYSSSNSDDWCMVRLTIDGDRFNTHPNVKDSSGKRHQVKFAPIDWKHATGKGQGKEDMLASDDSSAHKFTGKTLPDSQGHPWAQSEDRLLTDSDQIPGFLDYVKRIDIILKMDACTGDNDSVRRALERNLNKIAGTGKVHVFASLADFKKGAECPIEAIAPKSINESASVPEKATVCYRGFNSARSSERSPFSMLGCPNDAMWVTPHIEYAIEYASQYGNKGRVARVTVDEGKMNLATLDDLDECGLGAENAIDVGEDPETISWMLEHGFNAAMNYLDDSEDGCCLFDPALVRDIHVMTPEELAREDIDIEELECLNCDEWYRDYTSKNSDCR